MSEINLEPQPGPQTQFLNSTANIAIFGGAAGGGKSFALLLEPLRHYDNARFGAVIFRRNTTQVRNEGGLWDESVNMYAQLGARPREVSLEWEFPSGMRVKFSHLEHEKTVYDWQGAQIPLICFDELVHFTKKQFFYMMSRNRSTSGVPGYIRATCNPDVDSWVREFIDWWIGPDGFPIQERSGKLRWFIRQNDEIIWGDSREELIQKYGAGQLPKSVTFIPSSIYDNKILMEKDPNYLSNLHALPRVERLRLLGGNWNVRASAGMFFQREWFEVLDAVNANIISSCRMWDLAATEPNPENTDPDFTAGIKLIRLHTGIWVFTDLAHMRVKSLGVEQALKNTASQDGYGVRVGLFQDPGSAGKSHAENLTRQLAGYDVRVTKATKDKQTLAKPLSAQCEAGNVKVLRGPWNEAFFRELENFPDGGHDDIVDAASGAFNELAQGLSGFDVL